LGLRAKSSFGFHGRDLDGSQDYAGIMVFLGGTAPPSSSDGVPLRVGDIVTVTGKFDVFNQQDQIGNVTDVTITGHLSNPPEPIDITTRDLIQGASSPSEKYENLLLRIRSVFQRRKLSATDDDFWATDEMAETCAAATPPCVRVGDFLLDNGVNNSTPAFTVDAPLKSVTGIISRFSSPNLGGGGVMRCQRKANSNRTSATATVTNSENADSSHQTRMLQRFGGGNGSARASCNVCCRDCPKSHPMIPPHPEDPVAAARDHPARNMPMPTGRY